MQFFAHVQQSGIPQETGVDQVMVLIKSGSLEFLKNFVAGGYPKKNSEVKNSKLTLMANSKLTRSEKQRFLDEDEDIKNKALALINHGTNQMYQPKEIIEKIQNQMQNLLRAQGELNKILTTDKIDSV